MEPIKFSDLNAETEPYIYPNVWRRQPTTGPERVVLAPSQGQIDLIIQLTRTLPEPFGILYVLLVPRLDEHEPGRYQSAQPCDRTELEAFLTRFRDFFERDGRHHLWIFSLPSEAQIIYDNHNVVYGYGALGSFISVAEAGGLTQRDFTVPSPHAHHYNAAFDDEERALLAYGEWKCFPLAEND